MTTATQTTYDRSPHRAVRRDGAPEHGADLGDGRARADAAGGGRAGARGHVARARARATFTRSRSSRRCSGRCSSRWGRTCQTTTPTRGRGADTEDRLGPVRVTAGGLVPPKQVLIATYATFGLAVAVRGVPGGGGGAGADRGRRGVDPRGRAVHGRAATVWVRGAGRGVRVPVLRRRRGRGLVFRAGAGTCRGRRSGAPCRWACWRARSWW